MAPKDWISRCVRAVRPRRGAALGASRGRPSPLRPSVKRRALATIGLLLGLGGPARAATVSLGPGGGVGLSGEGAPTTVHLRVLVSGERAAFDFSGREGWVNGGDARSLGSLFFGGRFSPAAFEGQAWARLGFLHHHETPAAVVRGR